MAAYHSRGAGIEPCEGLRVAQMELVDVGR